MAVGGNDDVNVKFGASTEELDSAFAGTVNKIKHGAKDIAESFNPATAAAVALGTAFERVGEKIAEVIGGAFRQAIHAYAELGESIEHAQHRIGNSTEELSRLKVGLDAAGLSLGTFEGIARRLPMILQQHKEQFAAAGIAYHDAEGNLLPVQDVILNINNHLLKFDAGAARSTEAFKLMGRAAQQMADIIELTPERMAEAAKVAEDFGLVLSDKDTEATNEFTRETGLLHSALHGFYITVGKELTPMLTELAIWIRDALVPVFQVFRTVVEETAATVSTAWALIGDIFGTVGDAIVAVFGAGSEGMTGMKLFEALCQVVALAVGEMSFLAQTSLEGFRGSLQILVITLKGFGAVAKEAIQNPFGGNIRATWEKATSEIEAVVAASAARIAKLDTDWQQKASNIMRGGRAKAPEASTKNPPDPHAKDRSEGDFAMIEAAAARKLAMEKERLKEETELNTYRHQKDLESEQAFWTEKLRIQQAGIDAEITKAKADRNTADTKARQAFDDPEKRKTAQAESYKLTTQIKVLEAQRAAAEVQNQHEMQQAMEQRNAAMDMTKASLVKQSADAEVSIEQDKIKQLTSLRLIDDDTALSMQQKTEERSYQITKEFLEAKLRIELTTSSNIVQTKANAQLAQEKAYQNHQARLTTLSQAAELKRAQYSLQTQKSVESSFATMIFDLTDGVKRLSDVFRNFTLSIVRAFQNVISQRLAEKILGPQTTMGRLMGKFVDTITNGLDQILSKVILNEQLQTTATVTGVTARTAAEQGAASTSLLLGAGKIITKIMNYAAETFAGVFAFLSSFMGPFAAGPAALASASVAGMAGSVASSAGGDWMIPHDRMNIVHAQETILPADKSKKLDAMLEGGSGGRGMPNIHITAMDSRDVQRALQKGGVLHKELQRLTRGFAQVAGS